MTIVLSHKTAFKIYRKLRSTSASMHKIEYQAARNLKLDENYKKKLIDDVIVHLDISAEVNLELLFSKKSNNYRIGNYIVRTSKLSYPSFSFKKIYKNLYIPCPELVFYQLANWLSSEKLLLAGYEMCGDYILSPEIDQGFINELKPITNPKNISTYLSQLHALNGKCDGIKKAMNIANQIKSNSNSPQESRLSIMLCSKRSLGGYGVRDIELNKPVNISRKAKEICFQNTIIPDLCIAKNKIAIEYDSNQFHENSYQYQKDKLRTDALTHDGWKVFTFVNAHTHNYKSMHQKAIDILKANSQDYRFRSEKFKERQKNLYNALYRHF